MRLRRARPEEHDEIGAVTLAAYEPFLLGEEDFYRAKLLDAATRDREAQLWVATPDDDQPDPRLGHPVRGRVVVARDRPRRRG